MTAFDVEQLRRLHDVMAGHAHDDTIGGVAWPWRDDEVEAGVSGTSLVAKRGWFDVTRPSDRIDDELIVAVGALLLMEECRLRADDPVDDLLPELANRRVPLTPAGRLTATRCRRSDRSRCETSSTFRLGLGADFSAPWPQPLLEAMDAVGLGVGAPEPQGPPEPDEWMRRLSTLPLLYQPGERWLYHTGADVLGVLVARRGQYRPLDVFLRERGVRAARDDRHRLRNRARGSPHIVLRVEPRNRRTPRLRPARRAMDQAARVCLRWWRSRVNAGRHARGRPHAPLRRPAARRVAVALERIGRRDDDRSHRCRPGRPRTLTRRFTGMGLWRRRPDAARGSEQHGWQLRMGREVSARRGPTIPTSGSSVSCSRPTCSRAHSHRPPRYATSGRAYTRHSTTEAPRCPVGVCRRRKRTSFAPNELREKNHGIGGHVVPRSASPMRHAPPGAASCREGRAPWTRLSRPRSGAAGDVGSNSQDEP